MAQLKCIVYDTVDETTVNDNLILDTDTQLPVEGLDSKYKIYGEYIPFVEPPFDSRGWILTVTKTRIDNPHPVYPDVLTYEITYTLTRRSNEELYNSVDVEENWANEQLFPSLGRVKKQTKQASVLHKKTNNEQISEEEESNLEYMDNVNDAMDNNADNADRMKSFIEDNPTLVPDFDDGWTTSI